jgi:hypothetical protein
VNLDSSQVRETLRNVLAYSARQDYSGYSKHDGLNSRLLSSLLGWGKWSRMLAIQAVMRSPWNLRPLLGINHACNPKGLGLFSSAYLELYQSEKRSDDLGEAIRLLDWLLEHPSSGFQGLSWGYPYPWQDIGFYAAKDLPNRVVTCWIGFAMLKAAEITGEARYGDALPQIAEFLTTEPNVLHDSGDMKCYSYLPDPSVTWAVMDVPALVGAYLAEAGRLCKRAEYISEARRLITWVVDKQTDYGAWYYTHPPGESHITHDNYHTAIILDCIDRYGEASGDERFVQSYRQGLDYYERELFNKDGSPRWMNNRDYPHDIHGAASGILCFLRATRHDVRYGSQADRTLLWALQGMYDARGYFYYQETRLYRKKFTLLRWCNAWMAWAMAAWLSVRAGKPR